MSWDHVLSEKDFTYVNQRLSHKSCIDHFILSNNVYDHIVDNSVIFDSLNLSNHNIVELRISCFNNKVYSRSAQMHSAKTPNYAWYKSTSINLANYRSVLDNSLNAIKQNQNVLYCTDIKRKSIQHRNGINKLCKCIIDSCLDAGNATIPHTRTNDKTMPGRIRLKTRGKMHCFGIGFGVRRVVL